MLSDERIRELARGAYRADSVDDACEEAIRLAVAETAEACAVRCDDIAEQYHLIFDNQEKARVAEECAAAIREKARSK